MINVNLMVISVSCLILLLIYAAAPLICFMLTKTLLIMDTLIAANLELSGRCADNRNMAQRLGKSYLT